MSEYRFIWIISKESKSTWRKIREKEQIKFLTKDLSVKIKNSHFNINRKSFTSKDIKM